MAAYKTTWIVSVLLVVVCAQSCSADAGPREEAEALVENVLKSTSLTPEEKVERLKNYENQELVLDFGGHGQSFVGQWAEMCTTRLDRCSILAFSPRRIPAPARKGAECEELADYCIEKLRKYCRDNLVEVSHRGIENIYRDRVALMRSIMEYYEHIETADASDAQAGGREKEEDEAEMHRRTIGALLKLIESQFPRRIYVENIPFLLDEIRSAAAELNYFVYELFSIILKDGEREPEFSGDILLENWKKVGKIAKILQHIEADEVVDQLQ